jgi:hypothetical protein
MRNAMRPFTITNDLQRKVFTDSLNRRANEDYIVGREVACARATCKQRDGIRRRGAAINGDAIEGVVNCCT